MAVRPFKGLTALHIHVVRRQRVKSSGFVTYMVLTVSLIKGERDNILDEWFPN